VLYYETVQKAINFIEIHLKDELSLYDIAQHVNFSVPHFYRIFKAVVGETVKSYIMKRRLGCAAIELKVTNKNISEIAYEYSFESHDVFNPIVPNIMYGICENESFDKSDTFTYMAGIEVEESSDVPDGMVKRFIRQQMYIQAEVPEDVKTPDAYTKAFEYAKQNGYSVDEYDEIEVYEEVFKDPDYHAFKLLIPIK
jgi:AraC-like DNA-binding protein